MPVIASDHRERGNLIVVVLKDCEIASASPRNDTGDIANNSPSLSVQIQLDPKLPELPRVDRCGRLRHQVLRLLSLRERDDVSNRAGPYEQRHDPIEAEGEPAMRWGAVFKRLQEEPELGLCLFRADPQCGEHLRLHIPPRSEEH